ncbi:MAG: AI-2E family transporter [Burkholderiaceae bacterium]|jgi:predicted PurR-regulated permease PerM|nr:AI-2E family transporter [Burkholderiaceae bacterium]MDP4969626.1 AI-2E family transporter [Burkholderiaceae bacterium]MDP5111776.1 AI-2E family transporter [Burkholderiaceae bacterium]
MQPVLPVHIVARIMLVLLLAAGVYFFSGFVVPVLAALIVGFASWPIYSRWVNVCGGRTTLAASGALIFITLVLIAPISAALYYAFTEVSHLLAWLIAANKDGVGAPMWITALPLVGESLGGYWDEYLGQPHAMGSMVEMVSGQHIGNIYRLILSATGDVFHILLTLLFMLITLLFVYKDGHRMVAQLDVLGERVLPDRWQRLSRVIPATTSSTVTGMGLIAIGEGVVLGLAYWVAGVPSPVLLGVITAVMAMIPGGAPLSFTLVSLYLVGSGEALTGLALFAWGSIELFIVDKTLRPRLVGGPVKLPFLPTFFGLVGGVTTMGFVGLFIGPVLMALIVALWREWVLEVQESTQQPPS